MNNIKHIIKVTKNIILVTFFCLISIYTRAQSFSLVGCRPPYETLYLGTYNNELLYSRGDKFMCDVVINGIGRWDNFRWDTYGTGINKNEGGGFLASAIFNNQLYVGGHFYTIGGETTNKIARWDGQQWDSVGKGLDDQSNTESINTMAVYKNELYIAGLIRQVDGVSGYNHIAVWNGTQWRKIGGLLGSLSRVYCSAVYKNELYVGGNFARAGFVNAGNIAKWDGQQWYSVGLNPNSTVQGMVVDTIRNLLYVSGDFDVIVGNKRCKVAAWDGTTWTALGNDSVFASNVSALEMYHGYLYAAGSASKFDQKETVLARWDGNVWEPIPGFDGPISSLKTYNDELYIGGGFTKINNDSIPYLARHYSPDSAIVGINSRIKTEQVLKVYPNPAENILYIKTEKSFKRYLIVDVQGKVMLELKNTSTKSVDISSLPKGYYLLKAIDTMGEEYVSKFVK